MWFRSAQPNQPENAQGQEAQEVQGDPLAGAHPPQNEAGEEENVQALPEVEMPPTVNYDAQHADDEAAGSMEKAVNMLRNFQWTQEDLGFYFAQVEVKMKSAGVKSNFTKLQVLSTILPTKAINAVKNLLKKQESDFTNKDAYLQA